MPLPSPYQLEWQVLPRACPLRRLGPSGSHCRKSSLRDVLWSSRSLRERGVVQVQDRTNVADQGPGELTRTARSRTNSTNNSTNSERLNSVPLHCTWIERIITLPVSCTY